MERMIMPLKRRDGRAFDEIRPLSFTRQYLKYPEGAVLVEMGDTKIICTASVEEEVPPFLQGQGQGWVTAEYSLLPRSTQERVNRERVRMAGRTQEIQRLIGRSLRSVVDLKAVGERTIYLDCDVVQADGGTRTASVCGAFVALWDAFQHLKEHEKINRLPLRSFLGAVSAGVVSDHLLLDLDFSEDHQAAVDLNVVMTEEGELVEIQGTAEGCPFGTEQLNEMLSLSRKGIMEIIEQQKTILQEQ